MKIVYKFAVLILMTFAVTVGGLAQDAKTTKPQNLERGVIGPVSSNSGWSGYSALNLIPGRWTDPKHKHDNYVLPGLYWGKHGGCQQYGVVYNSA